LIDDAKNDAASPGCRAGAVLPRRSDFFNREGGDFGAHSTNTADIFFAKKSARRPSTALPKKAWWLCVRRGFPPLAGVQAGNASANVARKPGDFELHACFLGSINFTWLSY